jgi:hypothetical protein
MATTAAQRFAQDLEDEQEVLAIAADVAIEVFAMESALARAEKAWASGGAAVALHVDLARTYVADARQRLVGPARRAFAYLSRDSGSAASDAVAALVTPDTFDAITATRRIAAEIVDAEGWPIPS